MSDYIYQNQHEVIFIATLLSILMFLVWDDIQKNARNDALQWTRWTGNLCLTAINFILAAYVFAFVLGPWVNTLVETRGWAPPLSSTQYHWGYYFVPGVLFLEFVDYLVHRLSHKFKPLWRLHAIHHSDTRIDASTSHRHHPLEALVSGFIAAPALIAIGIPIMVSIWYPVARLFLVAFNHSNTLLPEWLDRILRPVIATPNFHRVHHFSDQPHTDSNFGTTLSIYDHLFGTAKIVSLSQLRTQQLGLETMRGSKQSRIDQLLAAPFRSNFRSKLQSKN